MISSEISKHILTIGPNYKNPKGGIAQVINVYSTIFGTFNYVKTTDCGNKFEKLIILIIAYIKVLYYCVFKDIKIVHIHTASYNSFLRKCIFIFICKVFQKKVILHIHGGGFADFYKSNPKIVLKSLSKCDTIVTLSSSWNVFFCEELKLKNVFVIPNVINYPVVGKRKLSNGTLNLLFLGLVTKDKGVFDLVNAISKKKNVYKNTLRFYIAGNGEVETLNQLIKETGTENIIKYIGFISGETKNSALTNADVYILPSYIEGLPISILEAMSFSLPIISTPIGGIPEIVNDKNGILVEPGNLKDLEQAIDAMIQLKELRLRMGKASYEQAKKYFPDEVEKKLMKMYTKLLK